MKLNERGFCIFYDWVECLEYLPREEVGEIIFALRDYYVDGGDPTERFEGATRAVVKMMLMQIKRAETRAKAEVAYTETKTETEAETETETETEKNKETKTNKALFQPGRAHMSDGVAEFRESEKVNKPTLFRVLGYAAKQGISEACAKEFYEYYRDRGWMAGEGRVEDWFGALKNWAKRSSPKRYGRGSARDAPLSWDDVIASAKRRAQS